MSLVINNTSALQVSSNETNDKRVLPKQNQSSRISVGLNLFMQMKIQKYIEHISITQNRPGHVNHGVDRNKKKKKCHNIQILLSSHPTSPNPSESEN